MTPTIDNKTLLFEAGGLYDGLVLLRDLESKSYWNHMTGECIMGRYEGQTLKPENLLHYSLEAALTEFPDLQLAISKIPFPFSIFAKISDRLLRGKRGFIPPYFRKTMAKKDDRLGEHVIGLGVVIGKDAKFYNVEDLLAQDHIDDTFAGKDLLIYFDKETRTPRCKTSDGQLPLQFYTRWYGFSYTFKNCSVYKKSSIE